MDPDPKVTELAGRLRGRLIAAAATPMDTDGRVDVAVLDGYLASLVADGAGGLAVCAHTGRGPFLDRATRALVIRRARGLGVPVAVGVAQPAAAEAAAAAGADALLVFPPATDPVGYHDALWRATGVPLLAFDLYTTPYPLGQLRALLAHPGVAGMKAARLHDAIACQDGLTTTRAAGRLAVTGEDRMFGPSLLWGAEAALVGIAAAAVRVSAGVLAAYRSSRYGEFVAGSGQLDALAAATFCPPYDGYVQRMLWIAAAEERIPYGHATDRYAPPGLGEAERERVLAAWQGL